MMHEPFCSCGHVASWHSSGCCAPLCVCRKPRILVERGAACVVCGEQGLIRYTAYRGDRPVACHHRALAEDGGRRTHADDFAETEVTGL